MAWLNASVNKYSTKVTGTRECVDQRSHTMEPLGWRRKQTPLGLSMILRDRKKEENREAMAVKVKETRDAMQRISWEERRPKGQQRLNGQESWMEETEYDDKKFIRCQISSVVDHIKDEEREKAALLAEKKHKALANKECKAREEAMQKEEEKKRKKSLREAYKVSTIDSLGMDTGTPSTVQQQTASKCQVSTVGNLKDGHFGRHSHWDDHDEEEDKIPARRCQGMASIPSHTDNEKVMTEQDEESKVHEHMSSHDWIVLQAAKKCLSLEDTI